MILDTLFKSLDQDIERKQRAKERLKSLPLEEFQQAYPHGYWTLDITDTAHFELPFDKTLIPALKELAESLGWDLKREQQYIWGEHRPTPSAGFFLYFYKGGIDFQVALRTGRDGDNCQIKLIGEQTLPLYEVTCGDPHV